jgi:two-component system copper resistance phosphate regulon response regulator CusR
MRELDLNYVISSDNNTGYDVNDSLVRIIFPEELQLSKLKKLFFENIPTVFILNNKSFLIKNKLRLLDFHISLISPIEILSLKEILNILLTKYNFFKKSKIIIKDYEINSNQRLIIKNGKKVKITEKELELILVLSKNDGLDKSFLLKNIWNHNSDLESHAFETHLHRLRKKINNIFKDSEFIIEKNSRYYLLNK